MARDVAVARREARVTMAIGVGDARPASDVGLRLHRRRGVRAPRWPAAVACAIALGFLAPGQSLAGRSAPGTTVQLSVSAQGFRPQTVVVHRGDPLRLTIASGGGEHCFALEALRVEKRVVVGSPVSLTLTPDKPGSFPFYCCLEAGEAASRERGMLVVTE
jgi:heme/copper-type cytochrome/quinol oxidase subunit 2